VKSEIILSIEQIKKGYLVFNIYRQKNIINMKKVNKISSYGEFTNDKEELSRLKRSFKPNNPETHSIPKNSKQYFDEKTRKVSDLTLDEVEDMLEGIKDYIMAGAIGLSTPSVANINTPTPQKTYVYSDKFGDDEWYRADGKPNLFKIVITETKRREGMGKRGSLLKAYMDGDSKAIGYGNHIKNLPDKWKKIVEKQNDEITEQQAREMLYDTFAELDKNSKVYFPKMGESQRWAVKSLAFNWGWGNMRNSGLWDALMRGETDPKVIEKLWLKTQVWTSNHVKSRKMEIALYLDNHKTAIEMAKSAYKELERRGDFKHYK